MKELYRQEHISFGSFPQQLRKRCTVSLAGDEILTSSNAHHQSLVANLFVCHLEVVPTLGTYGAHQLCLEPELKHF